MGNSDHGTAYMKEGGDRTNPDGENKSTNLRSEIYLDRPLKTNVSCGGPASERAPGQNQETRRCSKDSYPESYITKYTCIPRQEDEKSTLTASVSPQGFLRFCGPATTCTTRYRPSLLGCRLVVPEPRERARLRVNPKTFRIQILFVKP